MISNLGFIKPTDYRPRNQRPTNPSKTKQPTHRLKIQQSTDKTIFERLDNYQIFILQNTNTTVKI